MTLQQTIRDDRDMLFKKMESGKNGKILYVVSEIEKYGRHKRIANKTKTAWGEHAYQQKEGIIKSTHASIEREEDTKYPERSTIWIFDPEKGNKFEGLLLHLNTLPLTPEVERWILRHNRHGTKRFVGDLGGIIRRYANRQRNLGLSFGTIKEQLEEFEANPELVAGIIQMIKEKNMDA